MNAPSPETEVTHTNLCFFHHIITQTRASQDFHVTFPMGDISHTCVKRGSMPILRRDPLELPLTGSRARPLGAKGQHRPPHTASLPLQGPEDNQDSSGGRGNGTRIGGPEQP